MMDSIIYQNGLLAILIGSFFVFIVCVFCIGALTDRGICCHEHHDLQESRHLHTRLLFEQSYATMPQMFRHIAEMSVEENKSPSSSSPSSPPNSNNLQNSNSISDSNNNSQNHINSNSNNIISNHTFANGEIGKLKSSTIG